MAAPSGSFEITFRAIVFDLDGVLIDSQPLHRKAWALALARQGIHLAADQLARLTGITSPEFARLLEQEWGYRLPQGSEALIAAKRALYEELCPRELQPVPGADRLLRTLAGRLALGLCTVSIEAVIRRTLQQFGWQDLFTAVVGLDPVLRPKPYPDVYVEALRRLGVSPSEALVFEDSPVGIRAARAAGLPVVGVATNCSEPELRAEGVVEIIADFNAPQLPLLLGQTARR